MQVKAQGEGSYCTFGEERMAGVAGQAKPGTGGFDE